jgi:hypothetical protein
MKPIKASATTKAPAKKVWQAWMDMYQWKATSGKGSFKEGFTGHITEKGRKVPFKVKDVKKGEGFTTVWSSFLVKMIFRYEVKQETKGSLITCTVRFGGIFGFIARLFLKNKVRKNLSASLEQFAEQLDMSSQKVQIRGY